MRQYIRHTTDVPLQVQATDSTGPDTRLKNFSCGGLSFSSAHPIDTGQRLALSIDLGDPPFEIEGEVVWCHPQQDHYLIGVCFHTDQDAYSVRMVEQLCRIEEYREKIRRTEGRELDPDQAAREWIEQHAADFPEWRPHSAGH